MLLFLTLNLGNFQSKFNTCYWRGFFPFILHYCIPMLFFTVQIEICLGFGRPKVLPLFLIKNWRKVSHLLLFCVYFYHKKNLVELKGWFKSAKVIDLA